MNNIIEKALSKIEDRKQGLITVDEVIADLNKELNNNTLLLSPIEKSCITELIKDLNKKTISSLGMGIKNPYPVRYTFKGKDSRFRSLYDDKNGLVHGTIIYGDEYDLVCKSFRWFRYEKIYYGKKSRGRWYTMVEELAGVCDLLDKNGTLIETWSTATHFLEKYKNTNVALPDYPCQTLKSFIVGNINANNYPFHTVIEGFYKSNLSEEKYGIENFDPILNSYRFTNEDSSMLDEDFYTDCRTNLYGDNGNLELQKKWLVDPAYNLKSTNQNTFIVDSQYIKVYAPKDSNEVLILLPEVCRKGRYAQGGIRSTTNYVGKAKWKSKLFKI